MNCYKHWHQCSDMILVETKKKQQEQVWIHIQFWRRKEQKAHATMQILFTQKKKVQEMQNHNTNHDEVNQQMTQCLEMYILTYAHLTLTNVSVLKISLLNLAALILFANQSHLRNWYMHREGGRGATISTCGRAVTSFEMEWWYQTSLPVDGTNMQWSTQLCKKLLFIHQPCQNKRLPSTSVQEAT